MKKISLFVFLFFVFSNAFAQEINLALKNELKEILRLDQNYRALFDNNLSQSKKDEILKSLNVSQEEFKTKSWGLVMKQDSINLKRVEEIIKEYGYPGKSLVGQPENETAWYVIQHSDKISKYVDLIKIAANKGELSQRKAAMMEDRYLMEIGREQIYGTQGRTLRIKTKDGKEQSVSFIWPIKDEKNVNKLRKKLGFEDTIEKYAKDIMGDDYVYKPMKLKEALRIREESNKSFQTK
jgi:hypothetical protein